MTTKIDLTRYVTGILPTANGGSTGTNTGNQTITNTSDATSHTATLSATGGSIKLVEGSNITLTTTGTGADGVVTIASTASGSGDVTGPVSSVDNRVAFFNGTTGKIIKDSGLTLSGTNTGDQTITLTGAVTGTGTGSFATTIATPGTLTVSSTNNTATAHTHAVTSSSAPGVAASILATDASGHLGSTGTRMTKIWTTDIESTNMPTVGGTSISSVTQTLTNKRKQPRIISSASYTTDTGVSLDVSTCDIFVITAQAGPLLFNAPSGTPVQGERLVIRIKDNGTARALTWNAIFRAMGTALPTTTVLSKTLYLGFIYNSTDTKWDLVASGQEA